MQVTMRWLGVRAEMVRWLVVIHACSSAASGRRSSRVLGWVSAAARLSSRRAVTVVPLALGLVWCEQDSSTNAGVTLLVLRSRTPVDSSSLDEGHDE